MSFILHLDLCDTVATADNNITKVEVHVIDVNDHAPVFMADSLLAAVAEEAEFDTTVTVLQVSPFIYLISLFPHLTLSTSPHSSPPNLTLSTSLYLHTLSCSSYRQLIETETAHLVLSIMRL